jgi:mannose-6-phosphate isomerase
MRLRPRWRAAPGADPLDLLEGPIKHYDWGSPTEIPSLLGRPATGEPAAELWLGAHPSDPSLVGAGRVPLDRVVSTDPIGTLGEAVHERFGTLPFLFKVLAAAAPLSLQAHPSTEQAESGFAREESAGIALDAPNRSFRDRRHKPELVCALTPFRALCGFRPPDATLSVLETIPTAALDPVRDRLRADATPDGLSSLLAWLLTLEADTAATMVGAVARACGEHESGPHAPERAMAASLASRHPGDAGVVTALLLNLVTLRPGEALFLGAGNLHAYLGGMAVELMANSDNVLRGGLTSKHIDVETLLDVVDPTPLEPEIQRPRPAGPVCRYESPVPEFSLARIELDGRFVLEPGPAILLCTGGFVDAGDRCLDRGSAAWVPADDGEIVLEGTATIYRAGVGMGV